MKHLLWLFLAAFAPATTFGQYAIATTDLPIGTVNQNYSALVQTNSNFAATSCTVVSGALPAGLNLQPVGSGCTILGTPSAAGASSFSLTVSNNQGQTTSPRAFSVQIFGIVTLSLPTGNLNSLYSFQLQGSGGTGQYQWSLVGGSLPAGLSLSSSGSLTGIPQALGLFSFSLRLLDLGSGLTDTRGVTLSVTDSGSQPGGFQIISSALPPASVNQSYSSIIQTSGAAGNLSVVNGCTVVQGNLPIGISIGPVGTTCLLSGVSASPGNFPFQLQAIDSQGRTTPAAAFSLTVNSGGGGGGGSSTGTLNITTSQIPNGTTASAYLPNGGVFSFTATGGSGIYSWSLDSGSLPAGLTLNSNGTLTGTPRQAGSFNFTVKASSGGVLTSPAQSGTRNFVMTINSGGLIIVETTLPPANIGQPFSYQLHASGATGPYRWTLGTNELPGFAIDFSSGVITGTPQTAGTFSLPITVSGGGGTQSTQVFTLVASPAFTIVTTSLPDVSVTLGYSQTLQATGGQTPYVWSLLSGTLPPGMFLTSTGTVSGVPSANGLYTFIVQATDAAVRTATRALSIQVGPPSAIVIVTSSLPDGSAGTQYSQAFSASGGQSPYTWTLVSGSLPPGISLTNAGTLQGTPTQGGAFSFSVQAADSIGNATAKGFTLTIVSTRLSLVPTQLSFAFALGGGQPLPQQLSVSSTTATSFSVTTNVSWLSVSPAGGTTPTILSVSTNPGVLPAVAGVYNGSVIITPLGVPDPPQTVPVSLVISASSGLTVNPSALIFTYQVNGALPTTQFLSLGGSGSALSFTAFSNTSWLSVSPSGGLTPNTLSVSINPIGLAAGTYSGTVNIVGGGGSRQVPVTLTVGMTPAPIVTLSRTSMAFTYQLNGAVPGTQFATLSSLSPVSFSALSDSPWLSVTSNVGTTPATLFVSVNPQGLAAAVYTGNIVITTTSGAGNTTLTLPVTFTVSSLGFPVISTVVNAASYASGPLAPGEIVSISGISLGPTTPLLLALDSSLKVATSLGGVQVLFNGFPAPLTYVSATQINAVVPYEVAGQLNLFVAVRFQGATSVAFTTTTTSSAPGIFTLNASGTGPGAILNQDSSVNSSSNPAQKGAIVTLYVTGEGPTLPTGITGKVTTVAQSTPITPQPILPVSVIIGGQPVPVSFYGEAPGFVSGVMQVNARIPLNALSGDLPVEVSVGTNRSQSGVTVSVQ